MRGSAILPKDEIGNGVSSLRARRERAEGEDGPDEEKCVGEQLQGLLRDGFDDPGIKVGGHPKGLGTENAGKNKQKGEPNDFPSNRAGIAECFEPRLDGGAVSPSDDETDGCSGERDGVPQAVADGVQPAIVFPDDHAQEKTGAEDKSAPQIGPSCSDGEQQKGNGANQGGLREFGHRGLAAVGDSTAFQVEKDGGEDESADGGRDQKEDCSTEQGSGNRGFHG